MRLFIKFLLVVLLPLIFYSCQSEQSKPVQPEKEKVAKKRKLKGKSKRDRYYTLLKGELKVKKSKITNLKALNNKYNKALAEAKKEKKGMRKIRKKQNQATKKLLGEKHYKKKLAFDKKWSNKKR